MSQTPANLIAGAYSAPQTARETLKRKKKGEKRGTGKAGERFLCIDVDTVGIVDTAT